MRTQKHRIASIGPKPSAAAPSASSTALPAIPRVVLQNDLSASLQHLEGAELQRLLKAVEAEVQRRRWATSAGRPDEAAAKPAPPRTEPAEISDIPEGKANLVRASFKAGLKPAAIARTFGVSLSLVNRIVRAAEKAQR